MTVSCSAIHKSGLLATIAFASFLSLSLLLNPAFALEPYHQHHRQHHNQPQNQLNSLPTASPTNQAPFLPEPADKMSPGFRTVAYFVNWAIYGRAHNPQDIPASCITHLLYSFANVRPESGEVYLTDPWSDVDKHYPSDSWNDTGTNIYGCLKQIALLKRRHRNLKSLLSIGGWTYSSNFAAPASTESGRKNFARTSVQILKDCGFDGLDIDWEYPQDDAQARDLVLLLQACRSELDAYASTLPSRPHFLLTIAAPAGAHNFRKLRVAEMAPLLDFVNLMAYDYAGSWESCASHQANIWKCHDMPRCTPFSTDAAVEFYVKGGIKREDLVIGMPLYGRAFEATDGPGCAFSGVGQGSWENGVWDLKVLPQAGATVHHDPKVGASWSYDPAKRLMITFDSMPVIEQKVKYIHDNGLGGAMWWETSGDRPGAEGVIPTAHKRFCSCGPGVERSDNMLEYPESKYDNLRKGFPGEC